jgi:signal peptidase I
MTEAVGARRRRSGPEGVPARNGANPRDGPAPEMQAVSDLPQADWAPQGLPGMPSFADEAGEPGRPGKDCATVPVHHPRCQDDVWNMARVSAHTSGGQPVELLSIADEYTQECLSIMVESRITLEEIIDRLFDLFVLREVPKHLILIGCPQSLSEGLADWLKRLPVETSVSGLDSRCEDDGPGSLGARLREELLTGRAFATVAEARDVSGKWRRQYNETRPQRSPLEDDPQSPQGGDGSGCLEADPSVGQTLPPSEEPPVAAPPVETALVRTGGSTGWDTRWPRWAVYTAKAGECVGIVLVLLLLAMVVLALLAPHFGWRADTVLSGSMEPALPVGSVEVTRPVNTDEIAVGDIVTYRCPTNGQLMSHRVCAVEEGESYGFRTKGDNNEDADPYLIPPENVVGRYYFKVDHAGRVIEYLKTPLGFILLGLCGFALIAAEISTMLEVRWKEAARADTKAK